MKYILNVAVVSLALVSGCSHNPTSNNPLDLMEVGNRIVSHGCITMDNFEEKRVNHYDPHVIDLIKTVRCDGVEMQIYVSTLASDPNGLPIHLKIEKPNSQLPTYMNVGQSVSRLLATLGQPAAQNDREITYNPDESEDSVTFSIQGDRIKSIRWDWYIE